MLSSWTTSVTTKTYSIFVLGINYDLNWFSNKSHQSLFQWEMGIEWNCLLTIDDPILDDFPQLQELIFQTTKKNWFSNTRLSASTVNIYFEIDLMPALLVSTWFFKLDKYDRPSTKKKKQKSVAIQNNNVDINQVANVRSPCVRRRCRRRRDALMSKKIDVFRVGENLLALISFSCFQFSFVSNAHTNKHATHTFTCQWENFYS